MPKHVGFVMDGNRRYSRAKGIAVRDGHSDGFVALRRVRYSATHMRELIAIPGPRALLQT